MIAFITLLAGIALGTLFGLLIASWRDEPNLPTARAHRRDRRRTTAALADIRAANHPPRIHLVRVDQPGRLR